MRWLAAVREALAGVVLRRRRNAELEQELQFHLSMEAERLVREEGLPAAEARRCAGIAFGGVERHAEAVRDARGLAWLGGLSLDLRLAGRMLVRSWGLTLVGGLGMALAIALGAVFHAATAVVDRPLPLPDGERIVALEVWDTRASNQQRRMLYEFAAWRLRLTRVQELSAYRDVGRNLVAGDGATEALRVAEMTASGFNVAGVAPLLGRTLVEADEQPGAPEVVVLSHDVWQHYFGGDAAIIGRQVRLGATMQAVVGVMPEGFAFPISHRMWIPLRAHAAHVEPGAGPAIHVFGRLAEGATLASARAELEALPPPGGGAYLRARLMPYTAQLFDDMQGWEIPAVYLLLLLLLLVVCANVAVLFHARTATRASEIAVRSALGAGRRRIMLQLFVEALALALVAAAVGLAAAALVLSHMNGLLARWGAGEMGGLPFWVRFTIEPSTVLYVLGLALLAAAVVGVLPAWRAAGGSGNASMALRQGGGAGGPRLGRTWNALITAQVAITVALLPVAASGGWKSVLHATAEPGFPAHEYVAGRLHLDAAGTVLESGAGGAGEAGRWAALQSEFAAALRDETEVEAVTLAAGLPGQEPAVRVESDAPGDDGGHTIRFASVDPGFFTTFGLDPVAGRTLRADDLGSVVVSRSFVADVLGGGPALGRRFRYLEGYRSGGVSRTPAGVELGAWYEIVGVVPDFPSRIDPDEVMARAYHVLRPGLDEAGVVLARSTRGDAAALLPQMRQLAALTDPALQLREVRTLDTVLREMQAGMRVIAATIFAGMLSVLLLSAAGIYALMSFTVARRRREIGIRSALGADPGRLLGSIFARAALQLGTGAAAGLGIAVVLEMASGGALLDGRAFLLMPLVAAIMMVTGLLAALGPARRGLAIQPTEALRQE